MQELHIFMQVWQQWQTLMTAKEHTHTQQWLCQQHQQAITNLKSCMQLTGKTLEKAPAKTKTFYQNLSVLLREILKHWERVYKKFEAQETGTLKTWITFAENDYQTLIKKQRFQESYANFINGWMML